MFRFLLVAGAAVSVVGVGALLGLNALQRNLIYHPSRYNESQLSALPPRTERLRFKLPSLGGAGGPQVAYFVPATKPGKELKLWVCFCGNASRALDWLEIFGGRLPDPAAATLLVDYPGYGECAGRPSKPSIDAAVLAAYSAAEQRMRAFAPGSTASRLQVGVLGLSLGCAAGLHLGAHVPVEKIVLLAPFASLQEAAALVVGNPLTIVLKDKFDNRRSLAAAVALNPNLKVQIFHGTVDPVVPHTQGEALQQVAPQNVTLTLLPGTDHNRVALDAITTAGLLTHIKL